MVHYTLLPPSFVFIVSSKWPAPSFASTNSHIANLVVLCNFGNCTQLIKIKIQVLNW
jgi:hypothetical protein